MRRILHKPQVDQIKSFIRESCENSFDRTSPYYVFHKDLVAHYFHARSVEIDYDKKEVTAEIPVGGNNYTRINFECPDLSTFLSSCIREDEETLERCSKYIDTQKTPDFAEQD